MYRLLIIEDNPGDVRLIREYLNESDNDEFYIDSADCLNKGLARAQDTEYDLALIDLGLPDSTGLETMLAFGEARKNLPIIVLTGLNDKQLALKAVQQGAQDYLVKGELNSSMMVRSIRYAIERSKVEGMLRENEKTFRLIAENSMDIIFQLDSEGYIAYISPACQNILGHPAASVKGTHFYKYFTSRQHGKVQDYFASILSEDRPGLIELEMNNTRGELVFLEVNCSPIEEGEEIIGIQGIARDITEKKLVTAELRESEVKYRKLFENLQDVYYKANSEGIVTMVSPSVENYLGYTPDEMVGKNLVYDIYTREDDAMKFWQDINRNGSLQDYVTSFRKKDDTTVWASINAHLLYDDSGNITGIEGMVRDVTEQKRMEKQLIQAQKMESLGRLAGGVAHDFNNLLTGISMSTELLLMQLPEQHPLLEPALEIQELSTKGSNLTRQLLVFSRSHEMKPKNISINDAVQSLLKLLRKMLGEHISVQFNPDKNTEEICADVGQIEQVIMNLCVNARDAMPEGGTIAIKTLTVPGEKMNLSEQASVNQAGDYICLEISDTGSGIPEEIKDKVFDPFFTTKAPDTGTGLGLSIVHGIVKKHNGFIHMESEDGQGSTFSIYFPVSAGKGTKTKSSPVREYAVGTETILLVEDDDNTRNALAKALKFSGYHILSANDGKKALEVFSAGKQVDLVVTDFLMPEMDGYALYQSVKAQKPVPFLFLSGYPQEDLRKNYGLPESIPIHKKPIPFKTLLHVIRETLEIQTEVPNYE